MSFTPLGSYPDGLAGLKPLIWSEHGQSQLPVPKASWEVNCPTQTVFNLCRLDEVSHLALYLCVLPAACSPDFLAAAALSWGLMERDWGGTEENAHVCLVALPLPFLLIFLLALGWQLLLSSPRCKEERLASCPCISCQACVVD